MHYIFWFRWLFPKELRIIYANFSQLGVFCGAWRKIIIWNSKVWEKKWDVNSLPPILFLTTSAWEKKNSNWPMFTCWYYLIYLLIKNVLYGCTSEANNWVKTINNKDAIKKRHNKYKSWNILCIIKIPMHIHYIEFR